MNSMNGAVATEASGRKPSRCLTLVDVGQSGTRLQACCEGEVAWQWLGPGLMVDTDPVQHLADVWRTRPSDYACSDGLLVAGATGFHGVVSGAEKLLTMVDGVARVVLADDSVVGYLSGMGDRPGAVICAGTGVVALARGNDRSTVRLGGWGHLLDDTGGGFWIGRRGLRSAVRAWESGSGRSQLVTDAETTFGTLSELPKWLRQDRHYVAAVAAFAPTVLNRAEQGFEDAAEIVTSAGRALARAVLAALDQVDAPAHVSWAGALMNHPALHTAFARALYERDQTVTLNTPTQTAFEALALLAELAREPEDRAFAPYVDVAGEREGDVSHQ